MNRVNGKTVAELIFRCGSALTLRSGGQSIRYWAILQPVTSKSWQNMERMIPNVGEIPRGQYLYIGPIARTLNSGDTIDFDGRHFVVRRADRVFFQNEALFVWGLCVEGGGDDPWTT